MFGNLMYFGNLKMGLQFYGGVPLESVRVNYGFQLDLVGWLNIKHF